MTKEKRESRWFAMEEISDGEIRADTPEIQVQGRNIRPLLKTVCYDKHGQPMLMVWTAPMDSVPPQALTQLQQLLEGQHLTPVVIVPPQIKAVRLREMRAVEAREIQRLLREEQEEKRSPLDPKPQSKPGRIIQP